MTIAYPPVVSEPVDLKLLRWLRAYIICLAIAFVCVGFMWAINVFVIPHFQETFREHRTTLPPLTQMIMNGSHFFVTNPIAWIATLLLVIAGPVLPSFVIAWPQSNKLRRVIRRIIIFLLILGLGMYLAVTALALYLPRVQIYRPQ